MFSFGYFWFWCWFYQRSISVNNCTALTLRGATEKKACGKRFTQTSRIVPVVLLPFVQNVHNTNNPLLLRSLFSVRTTAPAIQRPCGHQLSSSPQTLGPYCPVTTTLTGGASPAWCIEDKSRTCVCRIRYRCLTTMSLRDNSRASYGRPI